MALAVAQTIEQGGALVVEAGTGIGKTFAYLVPALLSGEKVIISTATKALQDQLYARDLPRLLSALGLPLRRSLLKGRSNYVCLYRLGLARQQSGLTSPYHLRTLALVELWAQHTTTGDLGELPDLQDRSPLWPWVTSTRDNCLGSQCSSFRQCHVYKAREAAKAADVVVINHHLFFADWSMRESTMAELLPEARVIVLDEAHQLNDTGVQFLGVQLSSHQWQDLAHDLLKVGSRLAAGLADWQGLYADIHTTTQALLALPQVAARVYWQEDAPEGIAPEAWKACLEALAVTLKKVQAALQMVEAIAPDFLHLASRCQALGQHVQYFAQAPAAETVRWLDTSTGLRMVESPLDIASTLQKCLPHIQGADSDSGEFGPPGKAWIFTSATLGSDAQLTWFTQRCGLQHAQTMRVASPFDYAQQAALYLPLHLPLPSDPGHSTALARWLAPAVQRLGGRTLVLTTTTKALDAIAADLRDGFGHAETIDVLVQGEGSKQDLVSRFLEGANPGQRGCVLVATASFWEGFDVPGAALQMVVIDKLPFPHPDAPLVQAHTQRILRKGGNVFKDYVLPETAVALQQGAGRLIRHENDRGLLVVGDRRLAKMGYGKKLMAALPPMRRLQSEQECEDWLQMLTRTSTKDCL
jgi:ATP-dependent DNA helicase DinG